MSHEIRTPFNAVLGILDILGDSKLTKDQRELIQTAEKTSQGLLRIINDVLDYARISSGSVKIVNETFEARKVFDDVARLFAMPAKDQDLNVTINNTQADDIYLSGDIGRIHQILMNFVSNAIKYTRNGDVELIIETAMKQRTAGGPQRHLICKVKDTGAGIHPDKIKHLFEEFYMAEDVDTRATEGTGLGLTICKILTKMMNGTIGVESVVGQGSTFWVDIPLEQVLPRDIPVPVSSALANIKGKQILLAEDNATNRMVVTRILEKQGAILTAAENGRVALEALETSVFDLLLTDIFMPDMGGKELVACVRKGTTPNAHLPIIALTAMGDLQEAEQLRSIGVDQVVLKPFNTQELINAIAEQCDKQRAPTPTQGGSYAQSIETA